MSELIPLRVFRVYLHPDFAPSRRAQFELVALPFATPADVNAALDAGVVVRGLRLVAWPAPNDNAVRLIDRTWLMHLQRAEVTDVQTSAFLCMFRPSAEPALPTKTEAL
ncbi:hypothetical protein [Paragemmobacter straminiformis]|uniref:Uncharacterized protein n=1 Tax=Paragemmobacter straminiformis TaxID=2045119 RepID=A0A842I5P1_9RHOB|nr:hypothetical protein [Gemmobacter straminiformis]MBC2834687.1 hypothetical protein [Gemmobacter straminiformis]